MTGELFFKAQALDNVSSDHYQIGDTLVPPEDGARRQKVASTISNLSRSGETVLQQGGAELIRHGHAFLAQVHAVERDAAGRRAPILCCGEWEAAGAPETVSDAVAKGLVGFAAALGLSVEPAHLEAVRMKLKEGPEPQSRARRKPKLGAIGLGIGGLLFLGLLFVIFQTL